MRAAVRLLALKQLKPEVWEKFTSMFTDIGHVKKDEDVMKQLLNYCFPVLCQLDLSFEQDTFWDAFWAQLGSLQN